MNRLDACVREARAKNRKLFCGYITAGFPSLRHTEQVIAGFEKAGVDILEFGFPFSDPLADGPVIQNAAYQALLKGVTIDQSCRLIAKLRRQGVQMPVVFFSYLNPILHYGVQKCVRALARAGFDAVLCPDLPLGVDEELPKACKKAGLDFVRLIAPNNSRERVRAITQVSEGFIYYVSRKGITGTRQSMREGLRKEVAAVRMLTTKPVLIGFGVSKKEHVRSMCAISDGVIVGSAIVKKIKETGSIAKTVAFVRGLASACHRAV